MTERPTNAVDIFEDVCRREKSEKFVNRVDTLIDKPDRSKESKLAEIQRGLFIREGEEEDVVTEADDMETPLPNLQELCYYFEQAGVGLGREETFRIWLAMKSLVEKYPLESIRFWGKLFGIEENYYIAEVSLNLLFFDKYIQKICSFIIFRRLIFLDLYVIIFLLKGKIPIRSR